MSHTATVTIGILAADVLIRSGHISFVFWKRSEKSGSEWYCAGTCVKIIKKRSSCDSASKCLGAAFLESSELLDFDKSVLEMKILFIHFTLDTKQDDGDTVLHSRSWNDNLISEKNCEWQISAEALALLTSHKGLPAAALTFAAATLSSSATGGRLWTAARAS